MIIVINLFNQLFSHTAMVYISPIHHSARTKAAEYWRAARAGEGALHYLGAAVRSALFAAALSSKCPFSSFFYAGNKQRALLLCLRAWLFCRTLRLSSITDLTSTHRAGSDQTRCSFILKSETHTNTCTHTHTQTLCRCFVNFKGPIWQGTPTYSQQDTCSQGVHTFVCDTRHISQSRSPPLSLPPADIHTHTHTHTHTYKHRKHTQAEEDWLSRNSGECRKEHRVGLTHLFEIVPFLFKFTKRKSTTEINTLCSARNCGIVSTSCRSNEVTGGHRTDGVCLECKGLLRPELITSNLHL